MKKILVIRRDNIGDLICTTPMIRLLRKQYPNAEIDLLVNSYNAPVLEHNPDISSVFVYTKGKHKAKGQSLFSVYLGKILLLWKLRRNRYDLAIVPSGGYNKRAIGYAAAIKAKKILGYTGSTKDKRLTLPVELPKNSGKHEVEYCCDLLKALEINSAIPATQLVVTPEEQKAYLDSQSSNLDSQYSHSNPLFMGVHISARKPSNRWKEEYYIELIHRLWEKEQRPVALFWSPGPENHPQHPGDDGLAERILKACQDVDIHPMTTLSLRQLIIAMSLCNQVFCSDGGAMHVAAGLGKPIVCLFGDSDPDRWGPWGVPHQILQPPSRLASDVTPDEAMAAFVRLNA